MDISVKPTVSFGEPQVLEVSENFGSLNEKKGEGRGRYAVSPLKKRDLLSANSFRLFEMPKFQWS